MEAQGWHRTRCAVRFALGEVVKLTSETPSLRMSSRPAGFVAFLGRSFSGRFEVAFKAAADLTTCAFRILYVTGTLR